MLNRLAATILACAIAGGFQRRQMHVAAQPPYRSMKA